MDNPKIFPDGSKEWRDNLGRLHREDGPACDGPTSKSWYIHGACHRTDGPAIERTDGQVFYYLQGVEYKNKTQWKKAVDSFSFKEWNAASADSHDFLTDLKSMLDKYGDGGIKLE